MKKCAKCDAGMPDAANFCGYCGMRLPEIEQGDSEAIKGTGISVKGSVERGATLGARGSVCPACDNLISTDNKILKCKECGTKICTTCEGWIDKKTEHNEHKITTRFPLCEKCHASEVEDKEAAIERQLGEEEERMAREREQHLRSPDGIWERSKELVTVTSEVQAEVVKTGIFSKEYRYQPVQAQMEHRANSIGMKFVLIPGRNYYIGKFPVTQREWQAIMGNNPSQFKGDDLPVETVSVADCEEFIAKLNRMEGGQRYRLPTEGEWEHACRAGSRTIYCFGDDKSKLTEYAWYCDNSGGSTHGVGMKKPNAWGLHDMHGNVWEWTSSTSIGVRVNRGGGWNDTAGFCASACHNINDPAVHFNSLGFRLARSL